MKTLTGGQRYRCCGINPGGFGRSMSTEVTILEVEERDDDTGEFSWRYATYEDIMPKGHS